jgi:succinate dehydrogenase flavin-adding protein (antitoxin of CptAB toxin-antitoxin module)
MFKKVYYPRALSYESYIKKLSQEYAKKYSSIVDKNDIGKIIYEVVTYTSYAVGAHYRSYDNTFDILLKRFPRTDYHIKDDSEKDSALVELFWLRRGNPPSIKAFIGKEKWNQFTEEQQEQFQELTISATKRAINDICTTTKFMLERESRSINSIIHNRENIENGDDKWRKIIMKRSNSLPKVPDFK